MTVLPLSTLLSQALVGFTIELDNEFELAMPHITTAKLQVARKTGASVGPGPWLVSFVMWANFLQFVDEGGTLAGEAAAAGGLTDRTLHTVLAGMTRWGYVNSSAPAGPAKKPKERDLIVRPSYYGQQAKGIWPALVPMVEARWEERFGSAVVASLRASLAGIGERVGFTRPPFFPMVNYQNGLRVEVDAGDGDKRGADLGLAGLLSGGLLALTLDVESHHELSAAIAGNVLRVLDRAGVPTRDLPRLTGTSKEAVTASVAFLTKGGYTDGSSEGRTKLLRLTDKGADAQARFATARDDAERRLTDLAGDASVASVRTALDAVVSEGVPPAPAGTWRAAAPAADTVPHHPMVLHRGGYPDGS